MRTSISWTVVVAALVSLAACTRGEADNETAEADERAAAEEAADSETGDAEAATTTSPTSTDTSSTTEPVIELDLSETLWVVNGFDGLIDDRGRELTILDGLPVSGGRSTARAADGTLYLTTDGGLWSVAPGGSELVDVDLDAEEIWDLGYGDEGQVVTSPYSDNPTTLDDQGGRTFDFEVDDDGTTQSITAANGLTVRVIDPVGTYDPEAGYLSELETPAKLEVLGPDGDVEWTVEAGGSHAVWLNLIDFNGRHVMLARAPSEPADPLLQHIVYDLDCPFPSGVAPVGRACTQTFWTQFGNATLVGPDLPPGDNTLSPALLDLCPTSLTEVAPPLEMTEDWFGPAAFSEADRDAFEDLALALKACDPLGVMLTGDHAIAGVDTHPGLDYEAGAAGPDGANTGWMWTELARTLDGPFELSTEVNIGAVWQRFDGGPTIRLEKPDGYMTITPGTQQPPGAVAVVRTNEHIVVYGQIGQALVPAIMAAVSDVAGEHQLEVVDRLVSTTATDPDDDVDNFTAALRRELVEPGREVHLAFGDVKVSPGTADYTGDLELSAFALSDFADGGDGTFDELPLADEVVLALGSEVSARRSRDALVERNAWTVSDSQFRAYEGPFDILAQAGGPVTVELGVHNHCASPLPTPAPFELAEYRRVSLQPSEDRIDTCLLWSSVDLFIDGQGLIRGVSLDLWEP